MLHLEYASQQRGDLTRTSSINGNRLSTLLLLFNKLVMAYIKAIGRSVNRRSNSAKVLSRTAKYNSRNADDVTIHGGRVAKALACNARGDGFAPHLRRYFKDLFSRIDTVSGTEGLKMACVALRELTVPCNVSGDNW